MKIVISCSSILFDLEENELLDTLENFPYILIVCDFVYEKAICQDFDEEIKNLKIMSLSKNTITFIENLLKNYELQSYNNLCSLGLAKQEKCIILSNEHSFQKICKNENIECFDSSWIINLLNQQNL